MNLLGSGVEGFATSMWVKRHQTIIVQRPGASARARARCRGALGRRPPLAVWRSAPVLAIGCPLGLGRAERRQCRADPTARASYPGRPVCGGVATGRWTWKTVCRSVGRSSGKVRAPGVAEPITWRVIDPFRVLGLAARSLQGGSRGDCAVAGPGARGSAPRPVWSVSAFDRQGI